MLRVNQLSGFGARLAAGGGGGGGGGGATSYWNTGGRGDRTASITVTLASGTIFAPIANLINGGFATDTSNAAVFFAGQTNVIMKFDFGTAKIVDGFRWYQNQGSSQGTYAFEGSNDDITYTQIGSSVTIGAAALTDFTGANTTAYRYYQLRQTAGTTSNIPWLLEIEFRIAAVGDAARDAMEYGDRTALIAISTTASIVGGTINNLIDGALGNSSSDAVVLGNGQSTREIKFDLGAGKILTGFHWLQDAISHGTWVFEGSNDDISYTGLGSSFTLGGAQILEVTFSNSTAYRYYKLRQTAGTTSSSPFNFEIEFRIA